MTNQDQYIALLPQLLSSVLVLLVMALIALRRCHATIATVTLFGLGAALGSIPLAISVGPQAVTGLFIVDGLSLFHATLVLVAGIGATLLMRNWLAAFGGNREEMYLLLTLSVNGALTLASARHLAGFFIGLELMTVPMYGMAGYLFMQRRSLESAIKYLVLSAAATAFMLFGMALVYAQSGHLDFAGIGVSLATGHSADVYLLEIGLLLMLVGVAFKLSLAPFHQWTLDVYDGAPAPVGAFLATVGKVAVIAVLLRLLNDSGVFGGTETLSVPALSLLGALAVMAIASMLVGNLLALRQDSLKRLLAASSIAHFGYLLVALIAGGKASHEAAGMYLAAYVATTLGAFAVISALSADAVNTGRDADTLTSLRGLASRSPYLAVTLTVMLLSLAGMPLTAGFLGKLYVFTTGAQAHLWGLLLVMVVGSAIGLAYYLRVIATLWQRSDITAPVPPVGISTQLAMGFALGAVLAIGIWPQPVMQAIAGARLVILP